MFLPNDSAVEDGEARHSHEQDEKRGGHQPGVMTGTRPGDVRHHLRIGRIRAARGIVHISLQIGNALLDSEGLGLCANTEEVTAASMTSVTTVILIIIDFVRCHPEPRMLS